MNLTEAIVTIMLAMITREAPYLKEIPPELEEYRADIQKMAEIDEDVAAHNLLVDPVTDRLILGTVRFAESRFRSEPPDGDCYRTIGMDTKRCNAIGPMQIAGGVRSLIMPWPEVPVLGIPKPLTIEDLRSPETNVKVGYAVLSRWKDMCKGRPGIWLTAYTWGKCPSRFAPLPFQGRYRCKRLNYMMRELERLSKEPGSTFTYRIPENWSCGNEAAPKTKN